MTINEQEVGTKPTDKPEKNLLFIIGRLSPVGGEERSLTLLCNELVRREAFNVTVACMDGDKTEFPLDEHIQLVFLLSTRKGRVETLSALRKLIKQQNIHLIVGYGFIARPVLAVLGILQKTPVVFCERRIPFGKGARFKDRLKQAVSIFMLRGKYAVFQSNQIISYYKGLKGYTIIPNMLDVDILPEINKWQQRRNTIINASRFVPEKNLDVLIKAFVQACFADQGFILEIYGQGECERALNDLIRELNAQTYIFLKPMTEDIHEYMNEAKIYVCSSRAEGFPNALLEAMAMGMACVSTDCSGSVRDMIEDSVNGLVVPVGDIEAMSEALVRLMQDDETAEKMASRAAAVRQTNAKDKIIDKWIEYFLQCC